VADSPGSRTGSAQRDSGRVAAAAYTDPSSAHGSVSRGRFLTGVTVGLGGLIGAAIGVPAAGFALGPSFQGEDWYWVDLGPAENFRFEPNPDNRAFTQVTFERTPDGGDLERRIAFVKRDQEDVRAENAFVLVSNICMHLGCPVQANRLGFACPCHGGQYDTQGRRTAGPPIRPLNRFEYQVGENGHLYVGRVFATKTEGSGEEERVVLTDTWKDPGQPVEGLLSFLYPSPPR